MPNPRRPPQKKNLVALVGRTRAQHSLRLAARNYRTWIAAVAYGSPVYCMIDIMFILRFVVIAASLSLDRRRRLRVARLCISDIVHHLALCRYHHGCCI